MSVIRSNLITVTFVLLIFVLSFSLRIYGQNWDNGHHLHPDERFLTMVVSNIALPISIQNYLDTEKSPLNPYNYKDYQFFVYGNFPISIAKFVSASLNFDSYDKFPMVGRTLSAFFDSLNIILLYFISRLAFTNLNIKTKQYFWHNLAGIFYCFTVLPIQLSHFYAVDTLLNLLLLSTFLMMALWLKNGQSRYLFIAAIFFGAAFATKISSVLFTPVLAFFFIYYIFHHRRPISTMLFAISFGCISLIVFRVLQPYAFTGLFTINPKFIKSLTDLNNILNNRDPYYPPEIQYLSKTPIIYSLTTIINWGIGLPLSIFVIISTIVHVFKKRISFQFILKYNYSSFLIATAVFWIIFLVIEQGLQFTNTVRYFLPAYPYISLIAAYFVVKKGDFTTFTKLVFIGHVLFAAAFLNIYSRPHSRVEASKWFFENVPSQSKITNEYWDDPLPLEEPGLYFSSYQNTMLPLYDQDTSQKWQSINAILNDAEYMVMSSNRLWGSISPVPSRYPLTSKFYSDLFNNQLNFHLIARFTSYPGFSFPFGNSCLILGPTNYPGENNYWLSYEKNCSYPGIYFRDDTAEEAFTVYDHPQVLIYTKTK